MTPIPMSCSTTIRALASVLLPFALASASFAAPLLLRILPVESETSAAVTEVEPYASPDATEEASSIKASPPPTAEGIDELSALSGSPAYEVQSFAGMRPARPEQVDPQSQVVALVLADTLLDGDRPRVETEAMRLRTGSSATHPDQLSSKLY